MKNLEKPAAAMVPNDITEVVIATNAAALSAPFIRFAANESMLFGLPEGV